jgi:hypothetical protein
MKCIEETHNDNRVVIPISIHTGVGTQSQPVIPYSPADSPEYKEYVRCRTAPRTDNHRFAMKSLGAVTIKTLALNSFAPEVRVSTNCRFERLHCRATCGSARLAHSHNESPKRLSPWHIKSWELAAVHRMRMDHQVIAYCSRTAYVEND